MIFTSGTPLLKQGIQKTVLECKDMWPEAATSKSWGHTKTSWLDAKQYGVLCTEAKCFFKA
jgi:hypothetical protein